MYERNPVNAERESCILLWLLRSHSCVSLLVSWCGWDRL